MAAEAAKIPSPREDDTVIILDLVEHTVSLAKRGCVNATKEHYLGRAPNTGGMYRLLESEYSLIIADLKLSNLGWQAWWQRLHGRCNDIYSADALKKPEQESKQVPEQRSEQKAQQQKKDPKKALHAEPESQVFSYSSGTPPPPPYAP